MTAAMAIELVLAVLLLATIAAMVIMHRRLDALRAGRSDFERLAAQIGEAATRAEAAGAGLRLSAGVADQGLGAQITRAQALKDELAFLTERGERLAEEIGASVRASRVPAAAAAAQPTQAARREERPLPAALAGLR